MNGGLLSRFLCRSACFITCVLSLGSPSGHAGVIYDNLTLAGGPSAITGTVGPFGSLTFGAELSFARDVHVTSFALLYSAEYAGDLRFVIFDRTGSNPLYYGAAQAFDADLAGPTYKRSNPLDFTFRAGSTYALGAVGPVGLAMPYGESAPITAGGITATGRDPNFMGVGADSPPPLYVGAAYVQGFVRLYDDAATGAINPVPEPHMLALAGVGVACLAAVGLRPRRSAE